MPDKQFVADIVERMVGMGYTVVEPENPYWEVNGVTIEDPDGWRIVLQNTSGLSDGRAS